MRNVALYIDLAFCFVFLPSMIFAFPVERWWGTRPLFFAAFVGWLYVTYFLYKYFVVPRMFHGDRRRACALAAIVLSLAVTFLFSSYEISSPFYHLRQLRPEAIPYPVWGARQNQQAVWLHYIVVVFFCIAIGMLTEAYRQRMAREQIEYERNRAELALYKAQIDPHFFFNTLNTLYGLLITRSDKTEATLERFINLTKYIYNNASRDFIPLAEEVDYIDQYIALQTLRLNEFARVDFSHEVEDAAVQVPPMLLITFVENAFKYGISSNEACVVRIRLRQRGATLRFEVENSVFAHPARTSGRVGIENCRRRLALLYPDRHRLEARTDADGVFRVRLELRIAAL
ncbi:MAG: histidine kinase [Alistipes sp.]|nr:histidine kinase [Alistipes sp.]